jgi:phosphoenolpyruvate carboxykinase (ATP)
MHIDHTRNMVRAALGGELANVPTTVDPVFGFEVPTAVPGVPSTVLTPRDTWPDPAAYDAAAERLAGMFHENFEAYAAGVSEAVRAAGPRVVASAGELAISPPGEG